MSTAVINTLVLWFNVKWRPTFSFSINRLKALFSFGWKLLCSSLLSTVYVELTDLLIGKFYGTKDLAFFNQGKKFPQLIVAQINSSIDAVLFPAMSKHQDDIPKLKTDVRYSIKFSSFCLFPILLGMTAVAKDLVLLLLTEKWIDSVLFLQIASDIYLKLDIIKKIVGVSMLCIFLKKGVTAVALAEAASNFIGLIPNIYPNKKLLNYSPVEIIVDVLPSILLSLVMVVVVMTIGNCIDCFILLKLFLQTICGFVVYVGLAYVFKCNTLSDILNIIRNFKQRNNND